LEVTKIRWLQKEIQKIYDNSVGLKDYCPGGMYFFDIPVRPRTPYLIIRPITTTNDFTMRPDGNEIQTMMVQFTIVGKNVKSIYSVLEELRIEYDDNDFEYESTWDNLLFQRSNESGEREVDNDYYYEITYKHIRARSLADAYNPSNI
jgi:hypothetical protein